MILPVNYNDTPIHQRRAVREAYVIRQRGKCYYCESSLSGPPSREKLELTVTPSKYPNGFFNNPVHLHHDHVTGMTIGAVHAHCNAVLWEYHGE